MKTLAALAVGLLLGVAPAFSADSVKIGLTTTLTGPTGSLGQHIRDGAQLAVEKLGGKMNNVAVELIIRDDQGKPDVGRQVADEIIKRENVNFIMGTTLSNVLLAVHPLAASSKTIMFGGQAGPSNLAGGDCSPYFFSVGVETSTMGEAMGKVMADMKKDGVVLATPNYAGGRDLMVGFKRYFKGKVGKEIYTPLSQTDFQTEITQIRVDNPPAVFAFYPGGLGIQFAKQYSQAGLNTKIPLFTVAFNETVLPAVGDAAIGNFDAANWSPYLDNAENKAFVAAFKAKYNYIPSEYAAVAYDTVNLINSAVKATGGNLTDKPKLLDAVKKADFKSVRGPFAFNTNQFPVQNWYLLKMTKQADGSVGRVPERVITEGHKDAFASECKMAAP